MSETAPAQCVILVGGLGTRLGSLTATCPKPLLPVGGKPFLDTLLWHVARFGFERVLLLAGAGGEQIGNYAANTCWREQLHIEVAAEPFPLGTAGAIHAAKDRLDPTFLLINGNSVFDFNWLDLIGLLPRGASAALALHAVNDASRFGVARLRNDRVVEFRERGDASAGLINGGVYYMRREIAALCPRIGSLEHDVLPKLAASGQVCGKPYSGFFQDIGIPTSYAAADRLVPASRRRPAVFFDRDGVLNVDFGHVGDRSRFEWTEQAIQAVKLANDLGYFAFVVTNQSGIARGHYDELAVEALHMAMKRELRCYGAHLDDIRYCPHHPDGVVPRHALVCSCRKPAPGMITDLLEKWPIDTSHSVLIGDSPSDLEAANSVGIASLLFAGSHLRTFLWRALEPTTVKPSRDLASESGRPRPVKAVRKRK